MRYRSNIFTESLEPLEMQKCIKTLHISEPQRQINIPQLRATSPWFSQVDSALGKRKKKMSRQNYVLKTSDAHGMPIPPEKLQTALRARVTRSREGGTDMNF